MTGERYEGEHDDCPILEAHVHDDDGAHRVKGMTELDLLKWHYFTSTTIATEELKRMIDFLVEVILSGSDEELER